MEVTMMFKEYPFPYYFLSVESHKEKLTFLCRTLMLLQR